MANYNVTGNKIKFKNPMLIEGDLPDEPEDDALDPLGRYREDQMRQLDSQGAAPSGKPDLANPHPESMAGLKAANGGQIPQQFRARKSGYVAENFDYNKSYPTEENGPMASGHKYDLHLQERNRPHEQDYNFRGPLSKDMSDDPGQIGSMSGNGPVPSPDKYDADLRQKNQNPKKPVFRYDAGSIGNGQGLQNSRAATRPEMPDAGTASTTYGDSEFNSEQAMPWDQTEYNRIASNVGQENEPGFRGPPRSAMMPGVTPVEPNTKNSDLAVNPGFTPYYESETGKDVKEQGRQRLQEYLQKLAGRGKQHEERLAHDNDAAGAKARNDFGALLMDSASMMGTLGGKRADTTQLAKFPGKLYQADMAPSKSAMMYENAEDKDAKAVADIGDREDKNDISRQKLYDGLMSRREAKKQRDADEAGRNARNKENIASREKIAGLKPGAVKTGEIGPSGDEILSKDDQRIWDKLQTDTNTARAPRNSPQGRNQQTIDAAGRMLVLYDQGLDQKNGLTPTQMTEIATAAASLIGGNGTSSAQAQIEHLTPQTAGRTSAQIEQWLKNEPAGAKQMEFAKQFMDTALREGHQASENIKDGQTDSYMSSTLWDRAPKRMEDSYYRTVGDDAAYDESGRYVREPYVKLPDNRSSKAKNPQDADDEAWGKQHGLTFEQAKVIRDRRRAGNGGK